MASGSCGEIRRYRAPHLPVVMPRRAGEEGAHRRLWAAARTITGGSRPCQRPRRCSCGWARLLQADAELRSAREELARTAAQFAALLKACASLGIYLSTGDFRIAAVNPVGGRVPLRRDPQHHRAAIYRARPGAQPEHPPPTPPTPGRRCTRTRSCSASAGPPRSRRRELTRAGKTGREGDWTAGIRSSTNGRSLHTAAGRHVRGGVLLPDISHVVKAREALREADSRQGESSRGRCRTR